MAKARSNNYRYTKGFEFSLDGENYIGEYHLEGPIAKTEPEPSPTSKVLTKFYTNPDLYEYDKARGFPKRVRTIPNQIVWAPKQSSYRSGFETRYFVERIGNYEGYPIEIDSEQASLYGKDNGIDEGVYILAKVKWKLTGPERNMMYGNQLIEGIFEANQAEVIRQTRIIPNIESAIKNYTEYSQITMAPSDIGPSKQLPKLAPMSSVVPVVSEINDTRKI